MIVTRRAFGLQVCAVPLVVSGCSRRAEAPLAHLYGRGWVHGAYAYYGKTYLDLQAGAEKQSYEAYRVLAQRGVTSLDALQQREVPFHIRVDTTEAGFVLERDVPDVLMFHADMTDADRRAATVAWEKARDHIHTDYAEIKRLDWSLTRLLQQIKRVRSGIENTHDEQYRLTQQIAEVRQGTLPFPLPYEVNAKDYEEVLLLLIERLDDDRTRLEALEGNIVSVGLTVRATDAGSASLAANIRKVLVAIVDDASEPRSTAFPQASAERDKLLAHGRELMGSILESLEYKKFLTRDRDRALDQLGSLLTVFDQMTGLPTSKVYRIVLDIWRGDADYFEYLKKAIALVPAGRAVALALEQAIAVTERVRKELENVGKKGVKGALIDALVNTGTDLAKKQVGKQLVFFRNAKEAKAVEAALAQTGLMKDPLPKLLESMGIESRD